MAHVPERPIPVHIGPDGVVRLSCAAGYGVMVTGLFSGMCTQNGTDLSTPVRYCAA